ncbi:tetraspanin-8-like [Haliotis rufescens]|uniref:tetraspanin-8-like n=1 Tax=Haliotis rufescens TaxID=6454 RepID=UPI00201F3920|nr:tetraspanin-8-like [Haliotis rufescens]
MAASGCVRPCFIVFNLLFWLMGLFLVGFMAWTMATNPALITGFISGSRYFTYSILGAGVLIVLAGLFGCIGGLKEGTCLLKTFIAFTIIILLIEIGGAVTAYMMQGELQVYRDSGWTDFNTDTKNFLQTELKCCGFNSASEYGSTVADYPDSCFSDPSSKTGASQHNAVCWTKINEWLDSNMAIWAGTLGGVALVQIVSLILAIVMLSKVKKSRKVSSTSSNGQAWDGRHAARRGGGRRY